MSPLPLKEGSTGLDLAVAAGWSVLTALAALFYTVSIAVALALSAAGILLPG
jgi:hypothetical protein